MAQRQTPIDDRVTVRLGRIINERLVSTARHTRQKESEIIRCALAFFFDHHPTDKAVIETVINQRAKDVS